MIAAWVTTELASLELGDKRRESRAGLMVDQLAQICESQPDAAKSKAALKANYRFIHHPENSPEAILDAKIKPPSNAPPNTIGLFSRTTQPPST